MTTSLAASPVLPIATAGVAAALILGTLSSSPTSATADLTANDASGTPAAGDPGYTPETPAAPPATGKIVKKCSATACTITFPAEGGSVKGLGTTITATKFYGDGITVTIGATELVSNLATPAKGGGFTLTTVSVENGAQSPHTIKIVKKKK